MPLGPGSDTDQVEGAMHAKDSVPEGEDNISAGERRRVSSEKSVYRYPCKYDISTGGSHPKPSHIHSHT